MATDGQQGPSRWLDGNCYIPQWLAIVGGGDGGQAEAHGCRRLVLLLVVVLDSKTTRSSGIIASSAKGTAGVQAARELRGPSTYIIGISSGC